MATRTAPSAAPASLRPWLALIVGLAVLAGGWWWWRSAPGGLVVVISIDTLRADRLPAYGYRAGRTPAIDAFARDAVLFERAYAHAPQTLPSHASLLTGLLPFDHAVRDNLGFTLAPDATTLATMFRAAARDIARVQALMRGGRF